MSAEVVRLHSCVGLQICPVITVAECRRLHSNFGQAGSVADVLVARCRRARRRDRSQRNARRRHVMITQAKRKQENDMQKRKTWSKVSRWTPVLDETWNDRRPAQELVAFLSSLSCDNVVGLTDKASPRTSRPFQETSLVSVTIGRTEGWRSCTWRNFFWLSSLLFLSPDSEWRMLSGTPLL